MITTEELPKWDKPRAEWRMESPCRTFCVTVTRHGKLIGSGWCVYAYVRKGHRLFDALNVGHFTYYGIDVISSMPLHGGCTFFEPLLHTKDSSNDMRVKFKKGDIYAFKIGCDYSHLHDDHYSELETKEDAWSIFSDAEQLYRHLSNDSSIP
jgi:hypothetical protein